MNSSIDVLIVGAGLSGLAAATFLKHKQPDISLLVIEKEEQPGGAVRSHLEEGYLAEGGPHGFLDNCLESRVLIHEAGLTNEVEKAPLSDFVRYICLNGKLNIIPQSPGKIIRAPLISWPAKFRVMAELWKKPLQGEPSVAQWIERRFGKALLPFADAVFTGTYAGDIERLKIDGVMPSLRKLELEHGSVLRGGINKVFTARKEKKKEKKRKGLPAMTSFRTGMARLPHALADKLIPNQEIMYRTTAHSIEQTGNGWLVRTGQLELSARHLIIALPVNRCLALLNENGGLPAPPLQTIPEARLATVAMGFAADKADVPFGFGYLAPEQEQRFALGTLFSSHMFPGRAPEGHLLLETLVGGRRHPERLDLPDEEIVALAYADIKQLMTLPEPPVFSRVLRPKWGIPQMEEGYPSLLAWRNMLHERLDSLHICGFGWQGIGINDMHKESWKVAKRILSSQQDSGAAEIKGVYF